MEIVFGALPGDSRGDLFANAESLGSIVSPIERIISRELFVQELDGLFIEIVDFQLVSIMRG